MITSTANDKVKQLIKWQKKRKTRDEEGVFLVEGIRMFVEAPKDKVREIYVSESFYGKKNQELRLDEWGRKLNILSDIVFGHVSDTQTPQGVLAVLDQSRYALEQMLEGAAGPKEGRKRSGGEKQSPLLIVLDNLQDPGNLGTILRAGEAAGITGVIMSRDCVDIYNPKVIRSTMGSIYRVPFAYVENLPDMVRRLNQFGIGTYAAHLEGTHSYEAENYQKGTAFLIGNEGNGLSREVADSAGTYIRIPMCGQVESLNAAMAATVLLFEAARQRRG
ncbi:RNA methyltransferase [Roseburia hominis]